MALGRQILDRPLDAAANAVAGLPHAATGDAAERHDDVIAQVAAEAAARDAAIAVETAARIVGDLAHPGTITALTGDVTASGIGSVAATLTNIPQAVLLARTGALTADVPVNSHKFTGLLDGSNPQDSLAFHQLGDALAAQAFTVVNAAALVGVSAGDEAIRYVGTYRDLFRLDKSGTSRTAVPHMVLQSTVNAAWWWVRLCIPDPFWAAQYVSIGCWIDPAGTNSAPGSDESDGLSSSAPIKSIAEWRRRIRGAAFTTIVVINPLSGSTNDDDGLFYGFTTAGSGRVIVLGTPTQIGSPSTLTAGTTAGFVGNNRAQVVDSSLPTSWTDSYGVTTTSASRYIKRVGGSACIAPLMLDMGANTAMIGLATNTSETSTGSPTATITNFNAGDSYIVESRQSWPNLISYSCRVRYQCLDVYPANFNLLYADFDQFVLCGFTANATTTYSTQNGQTQAFNCVFAITASAQEGNWVPICCSFMSGYLLSGAPAWGSTHNVFLGTIPAGGAIKLQAGAILGTGFGTVHVFDCSSAVALVNDGSILTIGAIVGANNTGPLIQTAHGGCVKNGSGVTATTSKALPFTVGGTDYASPVFDAGLGEGIYN